MKIPEPLVEAAHRLEQRVGWQRLPLPVGVAVIAALRQRLRDRNLFDTGIPPDMSVPQANGDGNGSARYLTARMPDGSYNDVENPLLGTAGTRFSRNVPLADTFPETEPRLSTPNARAISRKLMTRDEFIPATSMNVLSAAWIQFEVHDWFSHGPNDTKEPYEIPLEDDDDWHERPMVIRRTPRDETSEPGAPQTWRTRNTHWWDGTQIYGSGDLAVRERTGEGASSASTRTGCSRPTSRTRSTTPTSPARCGRASTQCTSCSRSSTTRSATGWAPSIRPGATSSSTTRRGS